MYGRSTEVILRNFNKSHFARISTPTGTRNETTNAIATVTALGVTSTEPPRVAARIATKTADERKSPTVIAKTLEANENPKARPGVTAFFLFSQNVSAIVKAKNPTKKRTTKSNCLGSFNMCRDYIRKDMWIWNSGHYVRRWGLLGASGSQIGSQKRPGLTPG